MSARWIHACGGSSLFSALRRLGLMAGLVLPAITHAGSDLPGPARNPVIWADVPDASIVRVGRDYYMSSTTMHMSPGLPIMKSADLVNWRLIGYAYDTLADNEALRLENGRDAYGRGSWASSLRHHAGEFFATTFSATTGLTHVYRTCDPERGPWKENTFAPALHDHSLFFDDDGRVYMIHGAGRLSLLELKPDLSGPKPGGVDQVVIDDVNAAFGAEGGGFKGEGSQLFKVGGRYYLFNIASPRGRWSRSVTIHRADRITGPYEGRVALEDRGIAQGGLIDTPDGKWYAYLFRDNGAVGRVPYLVGVTWQDGWPVLGKNGRVPMTLDIPAGDQGMSGVSGVVCSDEFGEATGAGGEKVRASLPLAWQWNHNPDNRHWSLSARPGNLRLTNGRVDRTITEARNVLTQRTFGPGCVAETKLDVGAMKDGDVAGLVVLQLHYGYIGVRQDAGGGRRLVMVGAAGEEAPAEKASVSLAGDVVYLRAECQFAAGGERGRRPSEEVARFSYSLDGRAWTSLGEPSRLSYTVPRHFMGYRFGLFNFATATPGGYVDFDYYRVRASEPPPSDAR